MMLMVMVKLKMRAIYKSFLSLIGFLIFVATLLGVSYLFYDKVYNKIFQADEVPTAMPKHIVIYENNTIIL